MNNKTRPRYYELVKEIPSRRASQPNPTKYKNIPALGIGQAMKIPIADLPSVCDHDRAASIRSVAYYWGKRLNVTLKVKLRGDCIYLMRIE